ncbi:hypothetical protein C5167_012326 [Papaver somniferum]|uniref:Uncharacterized protein n=1 Tax=Papaver somniferum TaxID=3469 RepID=A0A4Y7J093_PAPSO|nr:hypothetical protein C5167_012326 [Papaver somniferum]
MDIFSFLLRLSFLFSPHFLLLRLRLLTTSIISPAVDSAAAAKFPSKAGYRIEGVGVGDYHGRESEFEQRTQLERVLAAIEVVNLVMD